MDALLLALAFALPQDAVQSAPAAACPPEHAAMGHCTPVPATTAPPHRATPAEQAAPAPDPACPPEHARMGHCVPKGSVPAPDTGGSAPSGTALPAGTAPAPIAVPADYADRIWGREAMASSRAAVRREHGGGTFSQILLDVAEYQFRAGRDGFRWNGEAWYGGDIHRLVVKSEGEAALGEGVGRAEVQALYSRAIDPYWNLQAGLRQDVGRGPHRTYAALGVEGLAPYWFEVDAGLFLSDRGDLLGRVEGYYDQRITQNLILQPRAEVNLSAQDMPANGIGSGLTSAELGLRLRYERVREFAPYIGISWERSFGRTADMARVHGEGTGGASFVIGARAWF